MLNINVGVLGHVDCGKTSLGRCSQYIAGRGAYRQIQRKYASGEEQNTYSVETSNYICQYAAVAALSTTLSTAALDKHPQSKERGITLDLGFSSFTVSAGAPHTQEQIE